MLKSPPTEEIIRKVRSGARIESLEAQQLYNSCDLLELGQLANIQRQRAVPGNVVTYLVDRNINYTNVCNTDCSFCAFYRHDPKDPESYVLPRELLSRKIEEALECGATRILLQGGHNDELPYSFYVEMIAWISSRYKIQLNAFSPSEIQQMERISGKRAEAILLELKQAGLTGLPGGGAEILDDDVRQRVSPKKIRAREWIDIMEAAQSLDLITTASMVIGFGETVEQRLNHLELLRDLQTRTRAAGKSGFNMFISWTLQLNENTSMGRSRHAGRYQVGAAEYLKNLSLARIYLDNIEHHQSSWPTLGPEIAQVGLNFGCDDIGSTMMEENVVSQAGGHTRSKWHMSPEELRGYIRGAGFIPAERDSLCNILRAFD
ncbi:MAG: CofH family radical SAM protein [Deltaproteobacteria bacterium]|nr:CofH family radical SAM protein [Deltaproteobacteria bacterium]